MPMPMPDRTKRTKITLETVTTWFLPRPRAGDLFAPRERRTLAAAAEVLLDGVDFPIDPEELTKNVERFLGSRSSRRAWRVRVLLTLLEVAPLLRPPRRPFSTLTRDERVALIRDELAGSARHVWALCGRIRPIVYLGAYASRGARRRVGWIEVPDRARFRLPLLEVAS